MYACMYACMHTYIHTYIHTYMHTYIHTCIQQTEANTMHTTGYKCHSRDVEDYEPAVMQVLVHILNIIAWCHGDETFLFSSNARKYGLSSWKQSHHMKA